MTRFELGTDGPSRILVGVDGSPASQRAGAYALGTARRQGAALIVAFVAPSATLAAQSALTAGAVMQTNAELESELREQLATAAGRVGVDAEFVRRTGNPYRELFDLAERRQVDLVIIGSSTASGRRFVGSLAGRLVRDAVWPITVVP